MSLKKNSPEKNIYGGVIQFDHEKCFFKIISAKWNKYDDPNFHLFQQ